MRKTREKMENKKKQLKVFFRSFNHLSYEGLLSVYFVLGTGYMPKTLWRSKQAWPLLWWGLPLNAREIFFNSTQSLLKLVIENKI